MVGVVATVDWDSLTHAAAFVLGALFGVVATLRVLRAVTSIYEPLPRRRWKVGGGQAGEKGRPPPGQDDDGGSSS